MRNSNKKIIINKMTSITIESIETFNDPGFWMGYKIIMNDSAKNIICKIENAHKCCEQWGVYTDAKLNDFVGAEYRSIDITKQEKEQYEQMGKIIITIDTDRGKIIIELYNEHNGYYLHDVIIQTEHGTQLMSI